jgi:hypothetical protein
MLHTDAFNKNVKRKMSKEDFVKNTRIDGVPPEILEVFFFFFKGRIMTFFDSLLNMNFFLADSL